jgi:hypothetical protein
MCEREIKMYERLWLKVIIQAFQDSLQKANTTTIFLEKKQAINWLLSNSEDTKLVFVLANCPYDKEKIQELLNCGLTLKDFKRLYQKNGLEE